MLLRTVRCSLAATTWLVAVSALGSPGAAQCVPQWQPGDPAAYVRGSVTGLTLWDPDGAGPAALQLVAGGSFSCDFAAPTGIAAFDGVTWSPIGSPPDGGVTACTLWNGQPVAAFGGSPATIASWNGTLWQSLGSVNGNVFAMAVYQGGLFVAGNFSAAGGVGAANIARWSGTAWSALGAGVSGTVGALAVFNNALYVGGAFTSAGGITVGNLALWNGSSWVATAPMNGTVSALAVRNTQTFTTSLLFAAGSFTAVGTVAAARIAAYNGSTNAWTPLGPGLGATVTSLLVRTLGITSYEVLAGLSSLVPIDKVWRWSSGAWSSLGSAALLSVTGLAYYQGRYVLGAGGVSAYDGATWQPLLGNGISSSVMAVLDSGSDIVIGGYFQSISGVVMNGIARGTTGAWSPLGGGTNGAVYALARLNNGHVVAAGYFGTAGGISASNIARWDGSSWSPLGAGVDGSVFALLVQPNGDLIAAGNFTAAGGAGANRIARWNGSTWSPLGSGIGLYLVKALQRLPNGDLVAAGAFSSAGGVAADNVARWNGVAWAPLGTGTNESVHALATLPNGNLIAAGFFSAVGATLVDRVARWDGASWGVLPSANALNAPVASLSVRPNGDLIAGGDGWPFRISAPLGGVEQSVLARFNGSYWQALPVHGWRIDGMTTLSGGDLVIVGQFSRTGAFAAGNVGRLTAPCPAIVNPYGAGCIGSAGLVTMTATDRPWTGSTYRATTTGIAPGALAFDLLGYGAAATPLFTLHPTGVPGCNLLATADATRLLAMASGVAASALPVPALSALVGMTLHNQVLVIELGPLGITRVTASNGVRLTVGTL